MISTVALGHLCLGIAASIGWQPSSSVFRRIPNGPNIVQGNCWFVGASHTLNYVPGASTMNSLVTTADPATQGALGVDADASNVYYALPSLGEVRYVPVAGGAATALAFAQGEPSFVYEDATHVYWTCTSAGVIRRATKPPAVTVSDFVTLQPGAYALAGTASDIYWAPKTTGP